MMGLIRYGDLATMLNLNQYRWVGTGLNSSEMRLAASEPGISTYYTSAVLVANYQDDGVPYSEALANGWLLRDAAGNLITHNNVYIGDVGSAGYQQAFAAHVAARLAQYPGLNGTYNDDFPVDPRPIWAGYNCASPGSWPVKYPSRAAWEAAMVSFAQNVGAYLHARGYYLIANSSGFSCTDGAGSNNGLLTRYWWQQIGPYFDGLMVEHWMWQNGHTRKVGSSWDNSWDTYADLTNVAQSVGADMIGEDQVNSAQAYRYGKATLALNWNCGDGTFVLLSSTDPWTYGVNQNLGCPTGAKYQVATNVWRRDFAQGYVIVNPTAAAVTVGGVSIPSGDAVIHQN
jgi:hypothetical protein